MPQNMIFTAIRKQTIKASHGRPHVDYGRLCLTLKRIYFSGLSTDTLLRYRFMLQSWNQPLHAAVWVVLFTTLELMHCASLVNIRKLQCDITQTTFFLMKIKRSISILNKQHPLW